MKPGRAQASSPAPMDVEGLNTALSPRLPARSGLIFDTLTRVDSSVGGRDPGAATAFVLSTRVRDDSIWFDGHFPGRPILPGVVQVHVAGLVAIELLAPRGPLVGTARLKFRRSVTPGDSLRLEISDTDGGADRGGSRLRFGWHVSATDEPVSSGFLLFGD